MTDGNAAAADVAGAFGALAQIRPGPAGSCRRRAWSAPELTCREWSADVATRLGLTVGVDRHAQLWTGWRPAGMTGDAPVHRDGVPGPPTTAGHAIPRHGEDLEPPAAEDLANAIGDATR